MLADQFYTPEFIQDHKERVASNMKERYALLSKAKDDKKAQAILIEKCKRDPKFFFTYFLHTDRNKLFEYLNVQDMPFILFPYQEEAIDELWKAIVN